MSYDQLNRLVQKDLPGNDPDVSYSYDLLGQLTSVSQPGHALGFTYDALGRQLTQTSPRGTITSTYDIAGRRTRITHPDQFFVDQDYLVTGEMTCIRENGATSGVGVLATFAYDDLGRRTSLTRGNGTVTGYTYDAASRMTQLTQDTNGSSNDLTLTFGYNPAAQIASNTRTNDAFSFTAESNTSRTDTHNGLNQVLTTGGTLVSHDARGNTTAIGSSTFAYDSQNRMTSAGNVAFGYDPIGRLSYSTGDPHLTRFAYDGPSLISEHDYDWGTLRRYVHGSGIDEPLVVYEGSGTSQRRFLHADERGSIIARSDDSGNVTAINRYDEYGVPATTNVGRLQYTGQMWMPEIGMYHFRMRVYNPNIPGGRFMQLDPTWPNDGPNGYTYPRNDPVNFNDPYGLWGASRIAPAHPDGETQIFVTGKRGGGCDSVSLTFCASFRPDHWTFIDRPTFAGPLEVGQGGGTPPTPPRRPCGTNRGRITGAIRTVASAGATVGDVAALGFGALALVTAPTGAGAVGFGTMAAIAKGVSLAFSVVEVAAAGAEGDHRGAASAAAGMAGGPAARAGFNRLRRMEGVGGNGARGRLADDATGTAAGQAVGAGICGQR